MNPNIGKEASKGTPAREARRHASIAAMIQNMPPLDSVANAQARLALINELAISGLLAGSAAGAAARAIEIWLKAEAHALDLHRIKELERTITELETELKRARLSRVS